MGRLLLFVWEPRLSLVPLLALLPGHRPSKEDEQTSFEVDSLSFLCSPLNTSTQTLAEVTGQK